MAAIKKSRSPLVDSLLLFTRNKPALMSLLAIGLLVVVAVTGKEYVGTRPSEDQQKLIEKAEITGDKLSIDVNQGALLDNTKTRLKDTFERPYILTAVFGVPKSESDEAIQARFRQTQLSQGVPEDQVRKLSEDEIKQRRKEGISSEGDKKYWLGTDDLGRDVLARLWSGSSISLTIGFLAVGISVLLGVALGGIAGFFGRSRVNLVAFGMMLVFLVAGVLQAADFTVAAIIFGVIGALLLLLQIVVALMGKRWRTVAFFGVVLVIAAGAQFYNKHVEGTEPNGRMSAAAGAVSDKAFELVEALRDLRVEVIKKTNGEPGALDDSELQKMQQQAEVLQAELDVEIARDAVVENEADTELAKRGAEEAKERVEFLTSIQNESHYDLASDIGAAQQSAKSEAKRAEGLAKKIDELNKAVEEKQKALEKARGEDPKKVKLQKGPELLDRRATVRQHVQDVYKSKSDNYRTALYDSHLTNGYNRYSLYRITRHFITATILILLLVIAVLLVSAASQAAVGDTKTPFNKLYIPSITVDDLVMRFTEIMLTIPVLFLILMILAFFERDVYIVMAVIGLTSWMGTTRFVRAEILSLREQDFVQAARALGVSDFRIIWRHLVPNAISPVLVSATLGVAGAVLAESTLSFLGIGAGPNQDTWGKLLSDGRRFLEDAPWLTWLPGIAILITVLCFNLLGEGLREAFNPKLRGR